MVTTTIDNQAGRNAPPAAAHLAATGIRKRFGGVEALRGVDFEVRRGEVMALVGDNGAGKSTLMKILAGAYLADEGSFAIDGKPVAIASPHDATDLGIQIVYQDLALCENLDVSANLSLGHEPTKPGWSFLPRALRPLDDIAMERKALEAVDRLRVRTLTSVRAKVGGLSGGQRQAIAIARAVGAESTIVLLDEPTAALGVAQTETGSRRRSNDCAKPDTRLSTSRTICATFSTSATASPVLRHGGNVAVYDTQNTNPDEIVVAMTRGLDGGKSNGGSHGK